MVKRIAQLDTAGSSIIVGKILSSMIVAVSALHHPADDHSQADDDPGGVSRPLAILVERTRVSERTR